MERLIKIEVRNAHTKEVVAYETLGHGINMGYGFYFTNDPEKKINTDPNELIRSCGIIMPIRNLFIGLHDFDGNEIYEGHICKIDINDNIYVVKFNTSIACFYFDSVDLQKSDYYLDVKTDHSRFIKIIGNIYENPELLEDKKWQ